MWVRSILGSLVNLGQCSLVAMIPNENDASTAQIVAFEPGKEQRTAILFVGTEAQCMSYLDDLFIKLSSPGTQERIATALEALADSPPW